jgi:hypothetical protein
MTPTQKQAHSAHHQLFPLAIPLPSSLADEKIAIAALPFMDTGIIQGPPPLTLPKFQPTPSLDFSRRCKVKGCVFQVSERSRGICWIHALWEKEPEKFRTLQPTHQVLEMAKYAITTEDEDTRIRQKLRARETRRAFLEGVA